MELKEVSCYHPGRLFSAISITGARCALQCPHCMGRSLSSMTPAENPQKLVDLAYALADRGALGFLLSGGFDSHGSLPVGNYIDAIRRIKETTQLRINAHIGYPHRGDIESLVRSGIDVYSINFPMGDRVGEEYLRIENAMAKYKKTVDGLVNAGAEKVIPHALIGLSEIEEDLKGMSILAKNPPEALVIIAFVPKRDTSLASRSPTSATRIISTLEQVRLQMPDTTLVLGCMRPRGQLSAEEYIIDNLIDGIVLPSRSVQRKVADRVLFKHLDGCCALYL